MKTKTFVFLFFLIVAGVMTLTSSVSWAQAKVVEVVVGNLSAMTGPTSTAHGMQVAGGREYLYYLNDKFGGIKGKMGTVKVNYIAYDTQYNNAKALDGFARLKDQGMIVTTHGASGHSDALLKNHERYKIPLVTSSHGVASPWSDWVFGTLHSGVQNMIRTWTLWQKREWEKAGRPGGTLVLGCIATDEPWVPLAMWQVDDFIKEHPEVKLVTETIPKGTTDASPQLLRLKDAGVKAIIVQSATPGVVVVLHGARAMNLNIPLTTVSATTLGDIINMAGAELAEGVQGEAFYEPMGRDPKTDESEGIKIMRECWAKNHPGQKPSDMYAHGFQSATVIAEGIRLALDTVPPEKLTGEALHDYGLNRIKDFTCLGMVPPFSYTPNTYHVGPGQVRYWIVRKGVVQPLTGWVKAETYRIPKKE